MCRISMNKISYGLSPKGAMDEVPLDEHVTGDQDLTVHCTAPEHKAFQLLC